MISFAQNKNTMKKLLLMLIGCMIGWAVIAQDDVYTTTNANYDEFNNYLTNGNRRLADQELQDLIRGVSQMTFALWASAQGEVDSLSANIDELDSVYGLTFTGPTFTYNAASYLVLDSISLDEGATYFTYIVDSSWVNSQIASEVASIDTLSIDSISFDGGATWYDYILDSTIFTAPTFTNAAITYGLTVGDTLTVGDSIKVGNQWFENTDIQTASDVATMINDSLSSYVASESDPIWAADSAAVLHWADTISYIATQYDISSFGAGSGEVDTTGLPVANQIAYFTAANKIGGNSSFLFTGSTRTNDAFYTGVTDPNYASGRLNLNANFHAYDITAVNNIYSVVLKTFGSTRASGYWYTGTTNPSSTNRLNYDGNLHVYNLYSISDLRSAVLNTNGSTQTAGYWYTGTTNPSNTTRINYDGALWATSFNNAVASISSTGVITAPEFSVTAAGNTDIDGTLNVEDGVYFQDTVAMASYTHMYDSLYLDYLGLTSGDTVALIVIDGHAVDSASLVIAAKAWTDDLIPYEQFFEQAYEHQALPLPYPNGTERRQPNAMYMAYQFEYELERLHRYMMPLYKRISLLEAESDAQKDRIYNLEREIENIYNLLGKKRIIKRLSK